MNRFMCAKLNYFQCVIYRFLGHDTDTDKLSTKSTIGTFSSCYF